MVDVTTVAVLVVMALMLAPLAASMAYFVGCDRGMIGERMRQHTTKGKPWRADGK